MALEQWPDVTRDGVHVGNGFHNGSWRNGREALIAPIETEREQSLVLSRDRVEHEVLRNEIFPLAMVSGLLPKRLPHERIDEMNSRVERYNRRPIGTGNR